MECGAKLPQHAIHCPTCGAAAPSELFLVYGMSSQSVSPTVKHKTLGKKAVLQVLEQSPTGHNDVAGQKNASGVRSLSGPLPELLSPTTEPLSTSVTPALFETPALSELTQISAIPERPAPAEMFGEEAFYQYFTPTYVGQGETGYGMPVLQKPTAVPDFATPARQIFSANMATGPQQKQQEISTDPKSSSSNWLRNLLARKVK
jgi:hypothetical protein